MEDLDTGARVTPGNLDLPVTGVLHLPPLDAGVRDLLLRTGVQNVSPLAKLLNHQPFGVVLASETFVHSCRTRPCLAEGANGPLKVMAKTGSAKLT